jgi:hypothetical protein
MITEYRDAELLTKKDKSFFLLAVKIDDFVIPYLKEILIPLKSNSITQQEGEIIQLKKVKFSSKNSSLKVPQCRAFFNKGKDAYLINKHHQNFYNLSVLVLQDKIIKRLKQQLHWSDKDRQLAGHFFELKSSCDIFDARQLAKKEIEAIFNLYIEPENSKSSAENVAASEKFYHKVQSAYVKLDNDLFHSQHFNSELIEKMKFGDYYGILILCPQLFEGLIQNEVDREKFKRCLLAPEVLLDSEKQTIFYQSNYVNYLRKHSDIIANAQEKGPLCSLLMRALEFDYVNQKSIIDSLTACRISNTDIGPRPNDRYKYLDFLPEELLVDTEFLTSLIIKDHEVFHHIPTWHQEPIKSNLNEIFHQSKDKAFFFYVFNYITDEATDNFLIQYISKAPNLSFISTLPENFTTVDLLLKSIEALKNRKLNHGDEAAALDIIYTLAIDKVNNSKMTETEKDTEMYKIHKFMLENNYPELGSITWDLIKNQKEFLA